jgi:WD40 repeat protein
VAFDPKTGLLVSAGAGEVRFWDPATGEERRTHRVHERGLHALAFSHDGKRVASAQGYDGVVKVWDPATGKVIFPLNAHFVGVNAVAYSRDGKHMATVGNDRLVKLWKAGDGTPVHTLIGHSHITTGVAFDPDDKMVVSSSWDGFIKLWDVKTGEEIVPPFPRAPERVIALAFSPGRKKWVATGSWDGTAQIWDVAARKVVATFRGHSGVVPAVAFSPDGNTLATASGYRDRGEVKLWDLTFLNR